MSREKTDYIGYIEKQPSEKHPLTVNFTNRLPSGATIASAAVGGYNLTTQQADNSIVSSTTGTVNGNYVSLRAQGGTDGYRYRITVVATLSDGTPLNEDIFMSVKAI